MNSNSIPHSLIAVRAHLIWCETGRPEGRSLEHWCQAEQELAHEAKLQRAFSEEQRRAAFVRELALA